MGSKLKWKFDASTFKLLGRGLITDRITAIYELVKNCYDANATVVEVEFYNAQYKGARSTIIIRDNGLGMTLKDIEDKWLVVGTASKRRSKVSPAPFNRRYIGEKGVGRFATDKLGKRLVIKTKTKRDSRTLSVNINWEEYEKLAATKQQLLFTDLENEYSYEPGPSAFSEGHGTELVISKLHEAWDADMLLRLDNQLGRIIPVASNIKPAFDIYLSAPDLGIVRKLIKPQPIESMATVHVSIPYDNRNKRQGVLRFDEKSLKFEIDYVEQELFGPVKLELFYFDAEAQKRFKSTYKNTENYIEGAKIYRDGVICTPFAEYESVLDNRRDILGIDKRRYREAFDKLSTREFIGIIHITRDGNPEIIDATNRQDFVDNAAYRRLKEFIKEQLDELSMFRLAKREENKERVQNNLKRASAEVKDISKALNQIVRERPELKPVLGPTIEKARYVTETVREGVKDTQDAQKEFKRKEALYLSLMSMQDFANDLAHGIRFALTPIKHASEYLLQHYPGALFDKRFPKYGRLIFDQSEKISSLVDFMLSYAQVDLEDTEFLVSELLDEVFSNAYAVTFERESVKISLDIRDDIQLTGNRKFLEDVFANLVSNSLKALREEPNKLMLCEVFAEGQVLNIIFSDNGKGVDPKIRDKMFEMFKTTTAEEGGAGLGLFIAKTRMAALNGTIELVDSVFRPKGASFKLTLPLKQK